MAKKSKTSSFGSPGRAGHDASAFYSARLYEDQPQSEEIQFIENPIPIEKLDTVFSTSSEHIPDHLLQRPIRSAQPSWGPVQEGDSFPSSLHLRSHLPLAPVTDPTPFIRISPD